MTPAPKVLEKRFDSSARANLPSKEVLVKVDAAFLKLLKEKGINTQKFGSGPEYASYDAPAFSNTDFFDKLFDLYRNSSNEEKVIIDVFRSITLQMCKQRDRVLYIGSENGIHPSHLSLLFDDAVVMNKYAPEGGDLLARLETNISNDSRYAPHSFNAFLGSHYAYFMEPSKHGQFNDLVGYLMKDGAPQHMVMHRHSGQTDKVVTDLGGTPGDGLNVGGMAELIGSGGKSDGLIQHVRSKVVISAVEPLAMMHKVGFLLLDTGAIVEAAVLADYVERNLKNGNRYSISRDDEHFIFKTPSKWL